MSRQRAKAVIVLALALAAFAGSQALRPSSRLADQRPRIVLATLFPTAFGSWVVDDRQPVALVSPDTQAVIDRIYSQTLSRTYVNRRQERIMLSVAYGGDQSDATRAHRPEVCYPAQGFQILSSSNDTLPVNGHPVRVRHLVARLGGRIEPITYWIVVGDRVATNATEQKLAQLSYGVRGLIADGMLVRVSSLDADESVAFARHQDFVNQLAAALAGVAREQVLGLAAP